MVSSRQLSEVNHFEDPASEEVMILKPHLSNPVRVHTITPNYTPKNPDPSLE